MNYIKQTFKDKKVIKALIFVLLGVLIAILGYTLFTQKVLKFICLFVGTILMFIQFPVISNTAMQYYEEEEAAAKKAKQNQMHPKKK